MIRKKSVSAKTASEKPATSAAAAEVQEHRKALTCAHAAIDKKAENVKILNISGLSSFTDYFVVCSAITDRQVQAIADSVKGQMKKSGFELISTEGYAEGRWVLMDFGDVVVHIFQDSLREYYDLEALWRDAPKVVIPPEYYTTTISNPVS